MPHYNPIKPVSWLCLTHHGPSPQLPLTPSSHETNLTCFTYSTSNKASSNPFFTLLGPLYSISTSPIGSTFTTLTTPPMATMACEIRFTSACTDSIVNPSDAPSPSLSASGSTCNTSPNASPNFSLSTRSIPIFIVTVDDAQLPQAPSRSRYTFPVSSSTLCTETLPPSEMRYGRTSSNTLSTLSTVNSRASSLRCAMAVLVAVSKGEMMSSSSLAFWAAISSAVGSGVRDRMPVRPVLSTKRGAGGGVAALDCDCAIIWR
mmetsp:Transcript_2761/g.4852  ORF Transcript_2761/g.4852 Transcript_2761/m.4852 type:complete len:261 (-) Transcript_2761:408-1190(-)